MNTSYKRNTPTALSILLFLIATVLVLYYGQVLLIPIAYGAMFAFLVNPIHSKLLQWIPNKYIAACISTGLIVFFVFLLLLILGWQIQELSEQWNEIKAELIQVQQQLQTIKHWFGITLNEQNEYASEGVDSLSNQLASFVGGTASILTNFFLSMIYSILILTERNRISKFFISLFEDDTRAENTIKETAKVAQNYLIGKMIIIGILAVTYSAGFLLVGIKYAILLGVLGAFLTFIPFAGNFIGGILAALITIATGGTLTDVMIIFLVMGVAQLIESYILQPWIVGGSLNLNPLFSILGVIAFGLIWGAAGAIVALPIMGVLKVLFDHIESYKLLGYLIGDD
jgi:predicted PurR-regulated permease PerM